MLLFLEGGRGNILRVKARGTLTDADHLAFVQKLQAFIQEHGRAGVVCELEDCRGWNGYGAWDDPTSRLRFREGVTRFAVIMMSGSTPK